MCIMPGMAARNKLDPKAVEQTQPTVLPVRKRKAKPVPEHLKGTRMAKDIRNGKKVPPTGVARSLSELTDLDPDDPIFKQPQGRPRTTGALDKEDFREGRALPSDAMKADRQKRANARRAKGRKAESVTVKAVEVLHSEPDKRTSNKKSRERGVFDEDLVVAEGIVNLDDWDDEELIRGYRRNRAGRFGPPPKFIPKDIQQEIFKRLVGRGDSKLKQAYLASIEGLTDLAHNADSEKVRLEAIKELMNRVVGKVPDRVHVAQEQPWEAFLADSIVPMGDEDPLPGPGEGFDRPALPTGIREQEAEDG